MHADKARALSAFFQHLRPSAFACGFAFLALFVGGCERRSSPPQAEVVLYTSVDQPTARPIIRQFEERTGIRVVLVTDTEATKSVGLAERVRAERANPQADVWWGNEVFHTINLAADGLLAPYESPAAKDIPARYKDARHRWAGAGLRARVVAVHGEAPGSAVGLDTLRDPKHANRIAMARPTAGTTGGHVASLYVLWGDDKADDYFRDLRRNGVTLLGGNGPVAEAVGRGQFDLGLTDNDDVASARREGGKLAGVPPDQGSVGTLTIPTTVGLVTGARHAEPARQLIDYLLSADVEKQLVAASFAGWTVRGEIADIKAMQVDYAAVAKALPASVRRATAILEGRE